MGQRTQFEELILLKSLALKNLQGNGDLVDMLGNQFENKDEFRNVCVKLTPSLSDELERVCDLLSISKRRFIESILIAGLENAAEIMEIEVDIFEHASDSADSDSTKQGGK